MCHYSSMMMMMTSKDESPTELPPSKLGTKEHWDNAYATELKNFKDHGDEGEVWFGEDSLDRIIQWLLKHEDLVAKSASILDLGCGNGITSINLSAEGFKDVTGVDYSEAAVQLAREIAEKHGYSELKFETGDILHPESFPCLQKSYRLCIDKGTYDAISLNPDDTKGKREKYIESVYNMLDQDGLLIITSCNWTENELVTQFQNRFILKEVVPTPTFKFGGVVGNMVTSIVFSKKE